MYIIKYFKDKCSYRIYPTGYPVKKINAINIRKEKGERSNAYAYAANPDILSRYPFDRISKSV